MSYRYPLFLLKKKQLKFSNVFISAPEIFQILHNKLIIAWPPKATKILPTKFKKRLTKERQGSYKKKGFKKVKSDKCIFFDNVSQETIISKMLRYYSKEIQPDVVFLVCLIYLMISIKLTNKYYGRYNDNIYLVTSDLSKDF